MPGSRAPGGPIHALARDAPGSHGRLIQGVSASFDHWRWAAIDSSWRRQSGVPEMSLPTPTVPVPPWLRVTSYLAFWTRLSYAAGTYYDSPDCDPNLSQRQCRGLPSLGACDSALRKRHRHELGALGVCYYCLVLVLGSPPDSDRATAEVQWQQTPFAYHALQGHPILDSARICAPGTAWPDTVRITGICTRRWIGGSRHGLCIREIGPRPTTGCIHAMHGGTPQPLPGIRACYCRAA